MLEYRTRMDMGRPKGLCGDRQLKHCRGVKVRCDLLVSGRKFGRKGARSIVAAEVVPTAPGFAGLNPILKLDYKCNIVRYDLHLPKLSDFENDAA